MAEWYSLRPLREGAGASERVLIFVRGHQGSNLLAYSQVASQSIWYNGFLGHGYKGQLWTYRWPSRVRELVSGSALENRIFDSADNLWNLLHKVNLEPSKVSLAGFSMGGRVIREVVRRARHEGTRFRRVYLFGVTVPRRTRWREILEGVDDRLYNFYSTEDRLLREVFDDSIGYSGLPSRYPKASDVDCSTLISSHNHWPAQVLRCLRRARLSSLHL